MSWTETQSGTGTRTETEIGTVSRSETISEIGIGTGLVQGLERTLEIGDGLGVGDEPGLE